MNVWQEPMEGPTLLPTAHERHVLRLTGIPDRLAYGDMVKLARMGLRLRGSLEGAAAYVGLVLRAYL